MPDLLSAPIPEIAEELLRRARRAQIDGDVFAGDLATLAGMLKQLADQRAPFYVCYPLSMAERAGGMAVPCSIGPGYNSTLVVRRL